MKGRAVAAAMLVSTASPGNAARIDVDSQTDVSVIAIVGDIEPDDADTFQAKTGTLTKAAVSLKSAGGDLLASLRIGATVRLKGFPTAVTAYCMGACASIWLAGAKRFMTSNARIGFHQAYRANTREVSGSGNALMGSYLARLGLGYSAILYATSARPNEMTWMTPEDARRVGIDVTVMAPDQDDKGAANPNEPGPRESSAGEPGTGEPGTEEPGTGEPNPIEPGPDELPDALLMLPPPARPDVADLIQCTDKYPDAAPGTMCCPWDYTWDEQRNVCEFSPVTFPRSAYKPLFTKQISCGSQGLARRMLCCPLGYAWDDQNNVCTLQ